MITTESVSELILVKKRGWISVSLAWIPHGRQITALNRNKNAQWNKQAANQKRRDAEESKRQ